MRDPVRDVGCGTGAQVHSVPESWPLKGKPERRGLLHWEKPGRSAEAFSVWPKSRPYSWVWGSRSLRTTCAKTSRSTSVPAVSTTGPPPALTVMPFSTMVTAETATPPAALVVTLPLNVVVPPFVIESDAALQPILGDRLSDRCVVVQAQAVDEAVRRLQALGHMPSVVTEGGE